jgi:hypothetical protein
VVAAVGGALEQRLAHLRATGVMQTNEQDGRHRQGLAWERLADLTIGARLLLVVRHDGFRCLVWGYAGV